MIIDTDIIIVLSLYLLDFILITFFLKKRKLHYVIFTILSILFILGMLFYSQYGNSLVVLFYSLLFIVVHIGFVVYGILRKQKKNKSDTKN